MTWTPKVEQSPTMQDLPETITADQAAAVLHCSRRRVYQAIASGELRAIKPLGRWLVFSDSVRVMLGQRRPNQRWQVAGEKRPSVALQAAMARLDPKLLSEDDCL